jgi:ribosomal protein L44E
MPDRPPRLGDVIDDYCPRCRLLLNHDVASLSEGTVAKVTCRTCFNTHDYRNAQVPARRKAKKSEDKKSLMDQVLAGMPAPPQPPPPPVAPVRKRRDLWAEVERLKKMK